MIGRAVVLHEQNDKGPAFQPFGDSGGPQAAGFLPNKVAKPLLLLGLVHLLHKASELGWLPQSSALDLQVRHQPWTPPLMAPPALC